MTLLGGIVGARIAPDPTLATLPVTVLVLALAATTVPASFMMGRWGRRRVFVAGAWMATGAALLAAYAIETANFVFFCLAASLLGANLAFSQQFRFAAAESVDRDSVARAVSWVMLGTLGAAVLAPRLAVQSRSLWVETEFAGSFIALAGVMLLAALVLTGFKDQGNEPSVTEVEQRAGHGLLRRPLFWIAVVSGVVAYGVMSLVMTATPISMHVVDGHDVESIALVIQSHVIAMYLPSLVSGWLMVHLGVFAMMTAGVVLLTASAVMALWGHAVHDYWLALVALGVGWNFLFVSGTTLLTRTYAPKERLRAQAINEFSVFGTMAAASLGAGFLIHVTTWEMINYSTLPVLGMMLIATVWAARHHPGYTEEGNE